MKLEAWFVRMVKDPGLYEFLWLPQLRVGLNFPELNRMFHHDPVSQDLAIQKIEVELHVFARLASHGYDDHKDNCFCEELRRDIMMALDERFPDISTSACSGFDPGRCVK